MTSAPITDLLLPTVPPVQVLDLDPKFLVEVAQGMEDAADIGARYGMSPEQVATALNDPAVDKAIERHRNQLRTDGYTVRVKAMFLLEHGVHKLAERINSNAISTADLISACKWLADASGQKIEAPPQTGNGFSVTINLAPRNSDVEVINVQARSKALVHGRPVEVGDEEAVPQTD